MPKQCDKCGCDYKGFGTTCAECRKAGRSDLVKTASHASSGSGAASASGAGGGPAGGPEGVVAQGIASG